MGTTDGQWGEKIATRLSKGSGGERLRFFPCAVPRPGPALYHRLDHPFSPT